MNDANSVSNIIKGSTVVGATPTTASSSTVVSSTVVPAEGSGASSSLSPWRPSTNAGDSPSSLQYSTAQTGHEHHTTPKQHYTTQDTHFCRACCCRCFRSCTRKETRVGGKLATTTLLTTPSTVTFNFIVTQQWQHQRFKSSSSKNYERVNAAIGGIWIWRLRASRTDTKKTPIFIQHRRHKSTTMAQKFDIAGVWLGKLSVIYPFNRRITILNPSSGSGVTGN